jgi:hypothetical protein
VRAFAKIHSNMYQFRTIVAFALLISSFAACKSDKEFAAQLSGKWILTQAQRNGNPTELLTGAYFEFTENTLKTNLLGEEALVDYTVEKGKIVQKAPQNIIYNAEFTKEQSLILKTTLRKSDFVLTLQRQ